MMAQFIENFFHLEAGQNRFDQHGGFDCSFRHVQHLLRFEENIVPQPRFEVVLQFGQIQVNPRLLLHPVTGIVEKIERKIEQAARSRLPVHPQVLFRQMPAARTYQQSRDLVV